MASTGRNMKLPITVTKYTYWDTVVFDSIPFSYMKDWFKPISPSPFSTSLLRKLNLLIPIVGFALPHRY